MVQFMLNWNAKPSMVKAFFDKDDVLRLRYGKSIKVIGAAYVLSAANSE